MDNYLLQESIRRFLSEDIATGDITSEAIFSRDQWGEAAFIAKEPLIAAGMEKVAVQVFTIRNPEITISQAAEDGRRAQAGDMLLHLRGPIIDLLAAERVALNLVQRLCGIATLTAQFVEKVKPFPARITDTRKTTPGLRILEKYAVRVGGGVNHRFNLSDGILIKDNHLAACASIRQAVDLIKAKAPHTIKIEVEVENLQQVQECLDCGVDIIMLDNMAIPDMRQAVALVKKKALVEASGGITLHNVVSIAETGVDLISIGALTHSAPAKDISMEMKPVL